jgi:hypothetical protein
MSNPTYSTGTSLCDEIEAQLEAHTLPGLETLLPRPEYLLPHYQGLGIANLPATVAALLGGELPGGCPPLRGDLWADWREGLERVILVLVDALGYRQLTAAMAADEGLVFHDLAAAGRLVPLTTVFPSTTNTVLTTLWTGQSPAVHGILAFELYLRELGVAASTLFFWPVHHRQRDELGDWGLEAEAFCPVPGLAERLAEQGIETYSLINKAYSDSMLSRIHRRGVRETIGYVSGADMWLQLQRLCARPSRKGARPKKRFLTAYWDTMDGITHRWGPEDASWPLELGGLSHMMREAFLDRLTPAQREGTLLLITADHGGVQTPPSAGIRLDKHPGLYDTLTLPPVGESRVPFFYTRPSTLERAQSYIQQHLSHAFALLTREQVLESGLLGPGEMAAETPHRVGDLVGVARGAHYLVREKSLLKMRGRHGGLSPVEMLVPLLGVRLDAL